MGMNLLSLSHILLFQVLKGENGVEHQALITASGEPPITFGPEALALASGDIKNLLPFTTVPLGFGIVTVLFLLFYAQLLLPLRADDLLLLFIIVLLYVPITDSTPSFLSVDQDNSATHPATDPSIFNWDSY